MFLILLLAALICPLLAQEPKPAPTIESLQAENKELREQLAKLQLTYQYEVQTCGAALQAGRQFVAALQSAPKPVAAVPQQSTPRTPSR